MNSSVDDIIKIKKQWQSIKLPAFLDYNFLESFFRNNKGLKHLFWHHQGSVLYAQIITLNLNKIINYSYTLFFLNYIVKLIKINILFLGNTYITNFSFFQFKKKYELSTIINSMPKCWSALVVPDFVIRKIKNIKIQEFIKVEIEEDMFLKLSDNWKSFTDYSDCLKRKYQKKINKTLEKSSKIKVRKLTQEEIKLHHSNLQTLYDSIMSDSKFNGIQFNVQTFAPLIHYNYVNIYGYFLKNKIVAFSSELNEQDNLYSYYVGFDKTLNKQCDLYSRILIDTIKHGILNKKRMIIFGRTASEFKSNFGAIPLKSYVYIKFKNLWMHYFFRFYLKNIRIKSWIQRNPFKIN